MGQRFLSQRGFKVKALSRDLDKARTLFGNADKLEVCIVRCLLCLLSVQT